jgi:hypothetical protein
MLIYHEVSARIVAGLRKRGGASGEAVAPAASLQKDGSRSKGTTHHVCKGCGVRWFYLVTARLLHSQKRRPPLATQASVKRMKSLGGIATLLLPALLPGIGSPYFRKTAPRHLSHNTRHCGDPGSRRASPWTGVATESVSAAQNARDNVLIVYAPG